MQQLADKLEKTILQINDSTHLSSVEMLELLAAASEAVGVLRTLGDFNIKQMMYDMSILAGTAGWYPDYFLDKGSGK